MFGEFLWILAGGAYCAGKGIKNINERAKGEAVMAMVNQATDLELETKLWRDINNPAKYNEIWERIAAYQRNEGKLTKVFPGLWDETASERLRFFGKNGAPIQRYQGNREYAHKLLIMTYDKMPRMTAFAYFNSKI